MNRRVLVDLVDHVHELLLGAVRRQHELAQAKADLIRALCGTALVGEVVLALPHAHDGERGANALLGKHLNLRNKPFCECLCNGCALHYLLGQRIPLSTRT